MPTELERIEVLERKVTELQTKVESIETDLALIPGLITTGFRQMDSKLAALRAHMDAQIAALRADVEQGFDATIRAVAEIIKEGK